MFRSGKPATARRVETGLVVCLLLLGIILAGWRLHGTDAGVNVAGTDAASYHQLGHAIANGELPWRALPYYFLPLPPLFYGGLLSLSNDCYAGVLLINTLFSLFTALTAWRICSLLPRLRPFRFWLLALLCLNWARLDYLKFTAPEVPTAALLAACLLAFILFLRTGRWRFVTVAGIALGLAALFRANVIVILIGWWVYFIAGAVRRRTVRPLAPLLLLTLLAGLVILPNLVRNWVGAGRPLPFTTSGFIFLAGNNPYSGEPGAGYTTYIAEQLRRDGSDPATVRVEFVTAAGDRFCYRLGWRFIREQPLAALRNFAVKAVAFWSEPLVHDPVSLRWLAHLAKVYCMVWGLGWLLVAGAREERLLGLGLLLYFLFHVLYLPLTRYRIPVDWLVYLCFLAGLAVHLRAGWRRWGPEPPAVEPTGCPS